MDAGSDDLADEQLTAWVAQARREPAPPNSEVGATRLRALGRARAAARPRGPELAEVRDLVLPAHEQLRVRLYRPVLAPRPLVVFLHGGGFVLGDLETHDRLCRELADAAGVVVLAVDYRRAPENPAPAAVDDAVAVAAWAGEHLDHLGADPRAGVALAGDSAGGALAVLTAARLRDAGSPALSALWLACPNADLTLRSPSVEQEAGYGLAPHDLRWFVAQWVPDPADRDRPGVSPLATDLRGLPPTLLATAGHDPLRDEGERLAGRLAAGGVEVRLRRHPRLVHGFVMMTAQSPAAAVAARALLEEFGSMLRGGATPGG